MPLLRARLLFAAGMAASALVGVALADSTGATSDPMTGTVVSTTSDATSVATTPDAVAVEILPADESWGGATRGEWSARWWQWLYSMPEAVNPSFDITDERCGYGQSGPVFFLPGNWTGEVLEVTCVVAEGTAIYVWVSGAQCSTVEPPPFFGRTEDELRACATENADRLTNIELRINGHDVPDLEAYRDVAPLSTIVFAEDNFLGVPPGVAQAVSDDYSVMIAPPPPGEYEVTISSSYDNLPSNNRTVTVIVEPSQVIEPTTT
jgi:hypothetical protein